MFNTFIKYEVPEDKGNHVKLDSNTWHGITIDTWRMDAEKPYNQLVGYFIAEDGREILLGRRDVEATDLGSLDFHNQRSKYFSDLIHWSFHGFADNLHYEISISDLMEGRAVIQPFPPANGHNHETIYLEDSIELGGRTMHWKVTSEKLTNGPFKQTIDFFVKNYANIGRHFIIDVEAANPFVKISNHYERHKDLIAETLGLDLSKK
ncbi:hypothetical protein pEaSNUABM37_00120 [Erwinia phage pEa_SNUABM_37]|nr:hypothetical protein pEaSNUABM37_00120 [Erwinia phage pEa_SNUABM_37]QXO10590.1 hypothetical protein pEaSNUABM48_00120 [Erwinia phage pEa_SNUABM_48]